MVGSGLYSNVGLEYGPQCHGVDPLTRPFSEDDANGSLEGKVDEQRNVVRSLLALRQGGEDEEALEAQRPNTLQCDGKRVQKALGNATALDDPQRAEPLVEAEDPREQDTASEDPLGVLKGKRWLDLRTPVVVRQQLHGGEGIDNVDSDADQSHEPKPDVRDICPCRCAAKVGECDEVPSLGLVFGTFFTVSHTAHGD